MSYLFVEKTKVFTVPKQPEVGPRILVIEPETDFLNLIHHVLVRENFDVKSLLILENFSEIVRQHNPEVVVISTKLLKHTEFRLFRQSPEFASIKLISIGDSSEHEELRNVLNTGFSGHLDRKFSQPKDLINLINCLLIF